MNTTHTTPEAIILETANAFGITLDDLKSLSRTQNIVLARQVSIWFIAKRFPDMTYMEIIQLFNNRGNHTNVIWALRKTNNAIDVKDEKVCSKMQELSQIMGIEIHTKPVRHIRGGNKKRMTLELQNGRSTYTYLAQYKPITLQKMEALVAKVGWKSAIEDKLLSAIEIGDSEKSIELNGCALKYIAYKNLPPIKRVQKLFRSRQMMVIGDHQHSGEEVQFKQVLFNKDLIDYELQVKNSKGEVFNIQNKNIFIITKKMVQYPALN